MVGFENNYYFSFFQFSLVTLMVQKLHTTSLKKEFKKVNSEGLENINELDNRSKIHGMIF